MYVCSYDSVEDLFVLTYEWNETIANCFVCPLFFLLYFLLKKQNVVVGVVVVATIVVAAVAIAAFYFLLVSYTKWYAQYFGEGSFFLFVPNKIRYYEYSALEVNTFFWLSVLCTGYIYLYMYTIFEEEFFVFVDDDPLPF